MGKIISRLPPPPPETAPPSFLKKPFRFIGGAPPFSPRSFLLLRHATSDFPGAAKCPSLSLATTNLSYLGRDQFLREILSPEREKDEGSVKRRRRLILFMLLLPLASQSRPPPNQKDTQKSFGPDLSSLPLCGREEEEEAPLGGKLPHFDRQTANFPSVFLPGGE